MNPLITYLQTSVPDVSPEALEIVEASFQKIDKEKGDILLSQGEVCRNLFFLSEGICRAYSIKDGNDITTWFSFIHEFITSFTSFFPKEPSYESIEMLSDGELYYTSYERLEAARKESREIEQLINFFSLHYTIQLEKRLFIIQTHSAVEKYQLILQQQPHLVQHIPNKHLASYLGISRETLSRIRSNIN